MKTLTRMLEKRLTGVSFAAFYALENTTNSPMLSQFYGSGNLPGLINAAFKIAISVGAILAVLQLAYAGFIYMGSADMWGEKAVAKEKIRNAVIGLLLLLAIYTILFQINPDLVNLNVLRSIGSSSGGGASQQVNQFTGQ
jgi:hypothetical protein